MESKQKKERSLKDLVDILLPKAWFFVVIAIIAAAVAFIYSYTRQDTYTSSARFLVKYSGEKETNSSIYSNDIARNKITNYAVVVDGVGFRADVVRMAEDDYGYKIDQAQFKSMFSFTTSSDAPVFSIHVTHTDPDVAYNLATAVKECVRAKIEEMEGDDSLVEEVDPPSMPERPNSKNEARNALISFLAGLIVSAGVVLVIALSDVTVRDKKKIEDNFDIPILGVIPFHDVERTQGNGSYGGYKKR